MNANFEVGSEQRSKLYTMKDFAVESVTTERLLVRQNLNA